MQNFTKDGYTNPRTKSNHKWFEKNLRPTTQNPSNDIYDTVKNYKYEVGSVFKGLYIK